MSRLSNSFISIFNFNSLYTYAPVACLKRKDSFQEIFLLEDLCFDVFLLPVTIRRHITCRWLIETWYEIFLSNIYTIKIEELNSLINSNLSVMVLFPNLNVIGASLLISLFTRKKFCCISKFLIFCDFA